MSFHPHHLPRLALTLSLLAAVVACSPPAAPSAPGASEPSAPGTAAPTGAAAAADGPGAGPDSAAPVEVRIKLTEFAIESSLTRFQTGVPYELVIESAGALAHDLRITHAGEAASMLALHKDGKVHEHGTELLIVHEPDLQPGATFRTELTFTVPGDYEFGCHVAGHLESGMLLPFSVIGDLVAMPTAIDPASITFDASAMAGLPCHAMGLTIMGDCQPEDVERLKAEILAKDAAARAKLGGGAMAGDDHAPADDHAQADDHGSGDAHDHEATATPGG